MTNPIEQRGGNIGDYSPLPERPIGPLGTRICYHYAVIDQKNEQVLSDLFGSQGAAALMMPEIQSRYPGTYLKIGYLSVGARYHVSGMAAPAIHGRTDGHHCPPKGALFNQNKDLF